MYFKGVCFTEENWELLTHTSKQSSLGLLDRACSEVPFLPIAAQASLLTVLLKELPLNFAMNHEISASQLCCAKFP